MKTKFLTLVIVMLFAKLIYGQTPNDDSTWLKRFAVTNEFNYNIADTASLKTQLSYISNIANFNLSAPWERGNGQWNSWRDRVKKAISEGKTPPPPPNYYITDDTSNFELSNGTLKLIARRHNPPLRVYFDTNGDGNKYNDSAYIDYKYTVGNIIARQVLTTTPYFVEVRMRLPEGSHKGISVAAWNYIDSAQRHDGIKHNEIDIFEYNGSSKVYTHNAIWRGWAPVYSNLGYAFCTPSVTDNELYHISNEDNYWVKTNDVRSSSDTGWHTYGVEVNQSYVAYYVDGKQIQLAYFPSELKNPYNPHKFLEVISTQVPYWVKDMNFQLGINTQPGYNDVPGEPDSTVSFPFEVEFDYVRYYRPRFTMQNTELNELNYNLDYHPESIFKKITLGGSGGSVGASVGRSLALRSVGEILLGDGFEIPVGTSIYIMNTSNK